MRLNIRGILGVKSIIIVLCLFVFNTSESFSQTSGNIKTSSKKKETKTTTKTSSSNRNSNAANAIKKKSRHKASKDYNSSSIFPTFSDQMKGAKPNFGFQMKTKNSFSTMMRSYKSNNMFQSSSSYLAGRSSLYSQSNSSKGITGNNSNGNTSNDNNKPAYKARTRGPFYQNSSSFASRKSFSLGRINNKNAPEKKVEQKYSPNLRYYNVPNIKQ